MKLLCRFGCLAVLLSAVLGSAQAADYVLFADDFAQSDGLITNEYAFWNPGNARSVESPNWALTSGSMYARGGNAWTGYPDAGNVDSLSQVHNNSAIFRLNTRRADFLDVKVSFNLLNQGLSSTKVTPAVDWDGIHIWLRYQSETSLYYASVNRRDGTSIIKKKVTGGNSNGGTYYELGSAVPHPVKYNQWTAVSASVQNNDDGSVTINLYEDGRLLVSATDDGSVGGPPIRVPGAVGIRGDNANLRFANFRVATLAPPNPAPSVEAIRPSWGIAGAKGFLMHVYGNGFTPSSVVSWNGVPRATRFVSGEELQIDVAAADRATPSASWVSVATPAPGGGASNGVAFIALTRNTLNARALAAMDPETGLGADASVVAQANTLNGTRVYPNPWKVDAANGRDVIFDRLTSDSVVKIFTLAGQHIRTLLAPQGNTSWNLLTDGGDPVASGVYLYLVTNAQGQRQRGKLAVIR